MIEMTYEQAVELLRKAVKFSTIKNQKHIDLSLVNAPDLPKYQDALVVVKTAVVKGKKTEAEMNSDLGLS